MFGRCVLRVPYWGVVLLFFFSSRRRHTRCALLTGVQTCALPISVIADVTFEVPGTYVLVDHALSRVEKGLAAYIEVEGPENPEVFREIPGEQLSLAK